MHNTDIIDEIIRQIEPELVPAQFIIMAKVCLLDGREAIVTGEQLQEIIEEQGDDISDIRVILDVRKIRAAIIDTTNDILAEVNRL